MSYPRRRRVAVACAVVAVVHGGTAEADALLDALLQNAPSSVGVQAATDSNDVSSVALAMDLGLPSAYRLQAGFTQTRDRSESAASTSNAYWLGGATDPLAEWSGSLSYERANSSDRVYSDTFAGSVLWSPSNWDFAWYPSFRTISLQRPARGDTVRIRNPGLGFQLGYSGTSFSLAARHDTLRYYSGVDSLAGLTAAERRALARDGQLYSETRNTLSASYRWTRVSLGAEIARGVSVIDKSVERRQTVDATLHVTRNFDLRAHAGRSRDRVSGTVNFGGAGCAIYWE